MKVCIRFGEKELSLTRFSEENHEPKPLFGTKVNKKGTNLPILVSFFHVLVFRPPSKLRTDEKAERRGSSTTNSENEDQ